MPIDTSSYYPEVPGPNGEEGYSLNSRNASLFDTGSSPKPESAQQPETPAEPAAAQPHQRKETPDDEPADYKPVNAISHLLSWVFTPLLMPVYGIVASFNLSLLSVARPALKWAFTGVVAAICTFAPMLLILLLKRLGMVQDLGLNGRRERLLPYSIMVVAYGITAWYMVLRGAPMWVAMFFAGGGVAALINMIINFRWKISAHAAGLGGVVALLIRIARDGWPEPELLSWLIIAVAISGLVGSARVWLGRHSVWQVLAGYIVGICSVFFLTMIK